MQPKETVICGVINVEQDPRIWKTNWPSPLSRSLSENCDTLTYHTGTIYSRYNSIYKVVVLLFYIHFCQYVARILFNSVGCPQFTPKGSRNRIERMARIANNVTPVKECLKFSELSNIRQILIITKYEYQAPARVNQSFKMYFFVLIVRCMCSLVLWNNFQPKIDRNLLGSSRNIIPLNFLISATNSEPARWRFDNCVPIKRYKIINLSERGTFRWRFGLWTDCDCTYL